jgi:hypothetical protein
MKAAYKGFNKDMKCRGYQFEEGKWHEEPEANCVKNGFHCAENPLDCLSYYPDMDSSRYWVVLIDGDIDENGSDTKISATKMKLFKEMNLEQFVAESVMYMLNHPLRPTNHRVRTSNGMAQEHDKFIIVRNEEPAAAGSRIGQYIGLVKDCEDHVEGTLLLVDGEKYKPGVFYDLKGEETDAG